MTNPPPFGWQPPQTGPENPFGQQPQYGFGHTPAPPGWPQPPAPAKNKSLKFLLVGVAGLLVIAISVGATLLLTRDNGDTSTTQTANPPSPGGVASDDDTAPVTIITSDPTCNSWGSVANTLGEVQRQGWVDRDTSKTSSSWTPVERQQYESVATAMRIAADNTVRLAQTTPHRVMRELYQQSIVYWRMYADRVPNYSAQDNYLALAAANSSGTLVSICDAISFGSAERAAKLESSDAPTSSNVPVNQTEAPTALVSEPNSSCADFSAALKEFESATKNWRAIDPNIPGSSWNTAKRDTVKQSVQPMLNFADSTIKIANQSGNQQWQDIASLSALYQRAYVKRLDEFLPADYYLIKVATYAAYLIDSACSAAG